MNINEEILVIANKLADEGKKPTVALIKTQLSKPVPLPTIISILKTWQHQPKYTAKKSVSTPLESNDDDKIVLSTAQFKELLQQAIQPLEEELKAIKKLLSERS